MCDEVVQGESKSEDGGYDTDGEGAIDGGPPAAMNTGVANEDEEADAEEKLGDTSEVEGSRIREDRHGGNDLRGRKRGG